MGNEEVEQKPGELNSGLARIEVESKKLCSIINELTGKLAPVMRAIEAPKQGEVPQPVAEICSPVGQRIDGIRRNIVDGVEEVETIMRHLEV